MPTKDELRQHYITLRRSLSTRERLRTSRAICQRVEQGTDWSMITALHIYQASARLGEVDTGFLIDYLRAEQPHIDIMLGDARPGATLPDKQFDLIIAPLVAFDTRLHRLGMGGGWYDRFLATQTHALSLGLAYDCQQADRIPTEPHDKALDVAYTEDGVLTRPNP